MLKDRGVYALTRGRKHLDQLGASCSEGLGILLRHDHGYFKCRSTSDLCGNRPCMYFNVQTPVCIQKLQLQ